MVSIGAVFILMRKILYTLLLVTLGACTNIECPLDNIVVMTGGLYNAEDGKVTTLHDNELSITSADGEYVLLNRVKDISSFEIPLRQGVGNDTLLFWLENSVGQVAVDTLFLQYTDSPHFESLDCPAALFHSLKEARCTSHPLSELPLTLHKVEIVRSLVDYDDVENLKIYLRSTAQ